MVKFAENRMRSNLEGCRTFRNLVVSDLDRDVSGILEIEILLTFVYFLECMEYNVRMLFPSIETGTAMNARESENYLPKSQLW
jgi:hypothetical protein